MRASRLLSILILLQLRGRLTAEALAAEFEVSVRTVYRDVEALSAAGVPVYADRGPGGGFRLLDGYRTRLTGLTPAEAESLFLAGLPGPAAELGLKGPMASARRKLLAALPGGGSTADRIAARLHLDPAEWYQAAQPSPRLPAIAQAVWDQRRLWLRYEGWHGVRERVVEPLGLVLKGGAWYVVARVGADRRTYKVASILDHRVEPQTFARPDDFDLPAHWAQAQRRFEAELRPNRATVRASAVGLGRLAALGTYARQAIVEAPPAGPDGWRTVELPVEGLDHAARQLLGLGPEVVVAAPAALRARVAALARQVARLHAGEAQSFRNPSSGLRRP